MDVPRPVKLCLTHNSIRVKQTQAVLQFYQKHFGMKIVSKHVNEDNNEQVHFLGYKESDLNVSSKETFLEIISPINIADDGILERKNCEGKYSVYWKIGLNLYDLEHAVQRLRSCEVKVTEPLVIPEVGVLCHVYDSEGYDTELMQYTLPGKNLLPHRKGETCTLGQDAILSVITIRVRDINKSLQFYHDILGMKLLCKQDQSADYGFDVYYLGFTAETPPDPRDPNNVSNREWTYQRPYTLLELEVYTKGEQPHGYTQLGPNDFGFKGIGIGCEDINRMKSSFQANGISVTEVEMCSDIFKTQTFTVQDPDDIPLKFLQIAFD